MKVILVGGGTAGHVNPNFAIYDLLKKHYKDSRVVFITSKSSFERSLFQNKNVKVYYIASGKLRRYFDIQNFTDPFKILLGVFQSIKIIWRFQPDVIFAKGGFTSVPVAIAAFVLRKKLVLHESDSSLGLANKICSLFTRHIWYSSDRFISPKPNFKKVKTPHSQSLSSGVSSQVPGIQNLDRQKQTLLIMGGSSGAKVLNEFVQQNLQKLTDSYNVIHITGKINSTIKNNKKIKNYLQFEYVNNLADIYAATDLVLSRAGAISLSEYEFLGLNALLVPLPIDQSRGDQIENAKIFADKKLGMILEEKDLNLENCLKKLKQIQSLRSHTPHQANLLNKVFLTHLETVVKNQ